MRIIEGKKLFFKIGDYYNLHIPAIISDEIKSMLCDKNTTYEFTIDKTSGGFTIIITHKKEL